MKLLSVREPWAWLIVRGYKDVDNRSWIAPLIVGQRIGIHASSGRLDRDGLAWVEHELGITIPRQELTFGGVVGSVEVTHFIEKGRSPKCRSPWFVGPYGWVFDEPKQYRKPVPCSGWLRLFDIPEPVRRAVLRQERAA